MDLRALRYFIAVLEAGSLSRNRGHQTLGPLDVQTAVRLHVPGELGKNTVEQGTEACVKYKASYEKA